MAGSGEVSWSRVRGPGGGSLEVAASGPPGALPLVFHLGTPGPALLFGPLLEAAARHGLRVVCYSRPGYAGSTPQPGRAVAHAAAETAAVLDAAGADSFITIGWSGGGPHALACAALLPGRCRAAVSLAGVAPYDADGLEWMAGMGEENVTEFSLALQGEQALTPFLEEQARGFGHVSADQVADAFGGLIPEVDRASLTGDFAQFMAELCRRSVSAGIAGWRDDDLAFVRPWGFDLAAITVPVAVWQGVQDRMVPFAHGQWLAAHIPGASARLFSTEGHLSLAVGSLDRIVGDLVGLAGGAAS